MKEFATVKEAVHFIRGVLGEMIHPGEAYQFVWLLFNHLRGYSKSDLVLQGDTKISHSEHIFLQKALERLKNHEPIQYVLGKTEFYGLPFKVHAGVLIPRPETEELVEWLLSDIKHPGMSVLDIGTGSGCIAVAVKKSRPQARVTGWDISPDVLSLASENAALNHAAVAFKKADILTATDLPTCAWDVIVSNPPYVTHKEKERMAKNVLAHEPALALFVPDDDPLLYYRAIARYAKHTLVEGGVVFLEINQAFGREVVQLFTEIGFRWVKLKSDLSGRHRMVRARL